MNILAPLAVLVAIAPGLAVAARGQEGSALPAAAAVAKPHAYLSIEPVPRGRTFEIAVVVEILKGFHMNAHKPSQEYLIPTTITPQLPSGIQAIATEYPEGRLEKFAFSPNEPLSVYTGSVTLRMKLEATSGAPLGEVRLPLTLRYQACNDTTCLPPVNVPVEVKFQIAATGAAARAIHPEIFGITAKAN
ncbi:MAG: protein-disulfide reductase DsbD domain-containing protein [Candidatus Acidiferrales bacterium]